MLNSEPSSGVIRGDFYKHLDECRRCAEGPFDLCPIGEELLEKEATKIIDSAYATAETYLSVER